MIDQSRALWCTAASSRPFFKIRALATVLALLNCLNFSGATAAWAAASAQLEYQVKAGFICNFIKYVEWPPSKDNGPLSICILGKTPSDDAFDSMKGRTVRNRVIAVRRIGTMEELGDCEVLFISASQKRNLPHILAALEGRGVLTVSDMKRFVDSGGMIGFVTHGENLRFEINLKAATRAGLRLSSQLLKLASALIE